MSKVTKLIGLTNKLQEEISEIISSGDNSPEELICFIQLSAKLMSIKDMMLKLENYSKFSH